MRAFRTSLQMHTDQLFQHTIILLIGNQLANIQKFAHSRQESLMKDRHNHGTLLFGMLM